MLAFELAAQEAQLAARRWAAGAAPGQWRAVSGPFALTGWVPRCGSLFNFHVFCWIKRYDETRRERGVEVAVQREPLLLRLPAAARPAVPLDFPVAALDAEARDCGHARLRVQPDGAVPLFDLC